jgi:hypothetical protein
MRNRFVEIASVVFVLFAAFVLSGAAAEAAQKFSHVRKDDNFDIYVDAGTMKENRGVYSFWAKSVLSESGKAMIRRELPKKFQKAAIAYSLDYFVYDANKNQYKVQLSAVYDANDKEIYKEGSAKQNAVKPGTLAEIIISSALEAFKK